MGSRRGHRADSCWSNWAGNEQAVPAVVHHPTSEEGLAAVVRRAAREGATVKVAGAGHSFTGIAAPTSSTGRPVHHVVLDRYRAVLTVDADALEVEVHAGITIRALNLALDARGLALANLGDIDAQTISGAISTATHGTGAALTGIAADVVGLRIVTADGSVVACSATEEPEIFHCARVGLGALGILSTVTLRVVPAFNLHVVHEARPVDEVLGRLDALVDGNDHFELFWVPHTQWALTKVHNRTVEPLAPRPRWRAWRDDVLYENVLFGAITAWTRRRPASIPSILRRAPASGRSEYVDASHRVFASPRWVRFLETEWAVPRDAGPGVLAAIRDVANDPANNVGFPVEVRFTAGDDVPLSTAYGRDTCYLACHVATGLPHERYFEAVQGFAGAAGGRPHWGKLHSLDAPTLAARYPEWERFGAVRDRLDPDRRFTNPYLERVLGS